MRGSHQLVSTLLVATFVLAGTAALVGQLSGSPPSAPETEHRHQDHPWFASGNLSTREAVSLADHAWKLPDDLEDRLEFLNADGTLRVMVAMERAGPTAGARLDALVGDAHWSPSGNRFVASVDPNQLVALLADPAVASVDPDFPVALASSGQTGTRAMATATESGLWRYNDATDAIEDATGRFPGGLTGDGVTVAVIDSGIDKTHPDFFAWDCETPPTPEETQLALAAGEEPPCPSRIRQSIVVGHLPAYRPWLSLNQWESDVSPQVETVATTLGLETMGSDASDGLATTHSGAAHGTHVSGVIAGNSLAMRRGLAEPDPDTIGGDGYVFGVAPDASLISLDIFDDSYVQAGFSATQLWMTMVVTALEWVLDHHEETGIRVVSNGWACGAVAQSLGNACQATESPRSYRDAVSELHDAGVAVVSPVGNGGQFVRAADIERDDGFAGYTSTIAAFDPHVLAVTAHDATGAVPPFAPHGTWDALADPYGWRPGTEPDEGADRADVAAPGVSVWGPRSLSGQQSGRTVTYHAGIGFVAHDEMGDVEPSRLVAGHYAALNGTSAATGKVAGNLALLIQACPAARPLDLYRAAFLGAEQGPGVLTEDGEPARVERVGYGAFDAPTALRRLLEMPICNGEAPPEILDLQWTADGMGSALILKDETEVAFEARVATPNHPIATWRWDFGDGTESTAPGATTHVYTEPGTYRPTLTVVDTNGSIARAQSAPLRVVDAAGFTEMEDSVDFSTLPGDGTEADPYVLENVLLTIEPHEGPVLQGEPAKGIQAPSGSHVVVRDVVVRIAEPSGPAAGALNSPPITALDIASTAGATIEDFAACGTPAYPINVGVAMRAHEVVDVTVCHATTAVRVSAPGKGEASISGGFLSGNDVAVHMDTGSSVTDWMTVRDTWFVENALAIDMDRFALRHEVFNNAFVGNGQELAYQSVQNPPRLSVVPSVETNIIGGPVIAGNFWDGNPIVDADRNGLGDAPYSPVGDSAVSDMAPLVPVRAEVDADVEGPDDVVNAGVEVTFVDRTDAASPIVERVWEFGDGARSATTNSSRDTMPHTYDAWGEFDARLTVTTLEGVVAQDTTTVTVNGLPEADFRIVEDGSRKVIVDATCGAEPLPCARDPEQQPLSFDWDFGASGKPIGRTSRSDPYVQFFYDADSLTPGVDNQVSITLTVTDDAGAVDQKVRQATARITPNEAPQADFSLATEEDVFAQEPVLFISEAHDVDDGIVLWAWEFGDGDTYTATEPDAADAEHTYTKPGVYAVSLTVEDAAGATHSITREIPVLNNPPTVVFDMTVLDDPDFPESGPHTVDTFRFEDRSSDVDGDIVDREWGLSDLGQLVRAADDGSWIEATFLDDGAHHIGLTVTDDLGGSDSAELTLEVLNTPPQAKVSWECDPACPGPDGPAPTTEHEIVFTDASHDRDVGQVVERVWTLGDMEPITQATEVRHRFVEDGEYPVSLSVTDDDGASDEHAFVLTIGNQPPVVDFTIEPARISTADTVTFRDASFDPDGTVATRHWDLGDGTVREEPEVQHQYGEIGTYVVSLVITDDDGAERRLERSIEVLSVAPEPSFTWSREDGGDGPLDTTTAVRFEDFSSDADGTIVRSRWDFGDGQTLVNDAPGAVTHRYDASGVYRVSLTVTDDDGRTAFVSQELEIVNLEPVVAIEAAPAEPILNETVWLNATGEDPGGEIIAWSWDFDDGATASGPEVQHRFTQKRPHEVKLTVVDDAGLEKTVARTIHLANQPPDVTIRADPAEAQVGQPVRLSFTAGDPDGAVVDWKWDLGGPSSKQRSLTWAFDEVGQHQVSVTVTDDDGATATARTTVSVANALPTGDIRVVPAMPVVGEEVRFISDVEDPDGIIRSWSWDFGDGRASTEAAPAHTYIRPGDHAVTLTVVDNSAAERTFSLDVEVSARHAPAELGYERAENLTVRFHATSIREPFEWDFGDGQTSSAPDPVHRYESPGAYLVVVRATDAAGEPVELHEMVRVEEPSLAVGPSGDDQSIPGPGAVLVFIGAVLWAWRRRGDGGRGPSAHR